MKLSLSVKRRLIVLHRWISLALVVFWLAQAGTGLLIVFHWELDDALIPGTTPEVSANVTALGAAVEALPQAAGAGWTFSSLWASGGVPGRFDIHIENAAQGLDETLRVTGNGTVLLRRSGDSWIDQVVTFHQNLLAGNIGSTIVGFSGLVLLSNIVMGLFLAWPGFPGLRRTLAPPQAKPPVSTYGRHRALGLIVAVPAIVLVGCGVLMVFEDAARTFLQADPAPLTPTAAPDPIAPAQILAVAMERFPHAALTALLPPDSETPYYVVRLRQPGELRRAFGKTTLEIAPSGDVLRVYEPGQGPWSRTVMDNLYPLHTGEAGGLVGRLVVMSIAAGLLTLMVLGLRLWWLRRK